MSRRFEAVMMIAGKIENHVAHAIDVENEEIDFEKIERGVLSSGEQTLVSWMECIWNKSQTEKNVRDPFNGFSCGLDPNNQILILQALAHSEGITIFTKHTQEEAFDTSMFES